MNSIQYDIQRTSKFQNIYTSKNGYRVLAEHVVCVFSCSLAVELIKIYARNMNMYGLEF